MSTLERDLWLQIAEAFDKAVPSPLGYRTSISGERYVFGLCFAIPRDSEHCDVMLGKIPKVESTNPSFPYLFPRTKEGCNQRAALCRRLANEC